MTFLSFKSYTFYFKRTALVHSVSVKVRIKITFHQIIFEISRKFRKLSTSENMFSCGLYEGVEPLYYIL